MIATDKNPPTIAPVGGTISKIASKTSAGPNEKATASKLVILPHLLMYGMKLDSYTLSPELDGDDTVTTPLQ